MARSVVQNRQVDRCELCGVQVSNARERVRHLRSTHPAYARSVLARIVAPLVLVAAVLILAAVEAPPVMFLVALVASYGVLFFGKVGSRSARRRSGARATLPLRDLMRQGGLRFVLVLPVVLGLVWLLGR